MLPNNTSEHKLNFATFLIYILLLHTNPGPKYLALSFDRLWYVARRWDNNLDSLFDGICSRNISFIMIPYKQK